MNDNTLKSGSLLKHGEYRIVRVLGQGGFGITYEAEQVSLGRRVAVKEFFMKDCCNRDGSTSHVSVPSVGSRELVEKFRQKFLREARMIAGLDHEHIVKIHDVFEENGTAYYVMEYLPGGSLADGVKRGEAMPEPEALACIRQIASALTYLHGRGIIHFDVKPSNIMMAAGGGLKLIDFGISKHYDESGSQTSSTPIGISKGYAPLEQYKQGSDIKSFTAATDVYSLGATLYALLAGQTPPEASDVNDDGLPIIGGVNSVVMHAIECAMQPKRKDRPQSVAAFLQLLDEENTGSDDDEDTLLSTPKPTPSPTPTPKPTPSPKPKPKPTPTPSPTPKPKPTPTPKWLWPAVACAAVACLVFVLVGRDKPHEEHPAKQVVTQSVQSSETPETTSTSGKENGHEWVDLGLSVKWATMNVGATSPEGYGSYFAWGETKPQADNRYSWESYKWCKGSENTMTKYCTDRKYGTVDNKTRLNLSDDAARANWGGSWRMPTLNEIKELKDNCTGAWTTQNGVKGYKVTSKKNGNSIFLPAAGYRWVDDLGNAGSYGYYWSDALYPGGDYDAYYLYFGSSYWDWGYSDRGSGRSVRAVCP